VKCAANTFTVSGTVSGLDGLGLKLANGATVLPITANGAFSFTVANGASYNVAVRTQPTLVTQDCAVSNGTGSNISADVTGVSVVCTSQRARFAYLTTGSNKVVPYAIGASGQLTAVTPGTANTDMGPTSIVMGATGRQGYVSTASGINQYNVADTGAVTAMNTPKVNAGNMASVLSLDAYNRYVFALNIFDGFPLNGTLGVFSIGSGTGALSSIGEVSTGLVPLALVAEPSGRFVYVGNFGTLQSLGSRITAYKADTLKPIVSTAAGDFVTALTADPTGAFVFALVGNIDPNSITRMTNLSGLATSTLQAFKIQPNGSLKSVNTMSIAGQLATSLVVHPSGRYAYAASTNGKVRRYTVNTTTGELGGAVDTTALSSAVLRIAIDPSGKFLFAATANGVTTYAVGLDGTLAPVQTLGSSAVTSMALGL
jgi:6-phosphogluconolactonase (cycloisomerase 2 family)